jgi:uncharacterized protein (DUF2141 family)
MLKLSPALLRINLMMRVLFCLLSTIALKAEAQNKIIVQVSNFENNKGVGLICLFDNAKAFVGKGDPIKKAIVTPSNGFAIAVFDNMPTGTYAISVIHDANKNNKFDTNFIGIPTEGYGASQNKLPFAAPPKFEANKFIIGAGITLTIPIKLRYLL